MKDFIPVDLVYSHVDEGNCRVYYHRILSDGKKQIKILYCFQSSYFNSFELYRCSRDGEPEIQRPIESITAMDIPKGETQIEKDLTDFIDKYPYKNKELKELKSKGRNLN